VFRLIGVAIAMTVVGCGGAGVSDADRSRARQVVEAYGRAYAAPDGEAGCRLLTDEMRARYERRGDPCPSAFTRIHSHGRRQLRLERASITGEQDEGLRGIVEFSERVGPTGGEVHLVEENDEWRLDEDLLCVTPSC